MDAWLGYLVAPTFVLYNVAGELSSSTESPPSYRDVFWAWIVQLEGKSVAVQSYTVEFGFGFQVVLCVSQNRRRQEIVIVIVRNRQECE